MVKNWVEHGREGIFSAMARRPNFFDIQKYLPPRSRLM